MAKPRRSTSATRKAKPGAVKRAKSQSAKAKRATAKRATAERVTAKSASNRTTKAATVASRQPGRPATKPGIGPLIRRINIHALHESDIATLHDHVGAALNLHKMIRGETDLTLAASDYCYTQAGNSDMVMVLKDGHPLYKMTEAEAHAQGIPSCG